MNTEEVNTLAVGVSPDEYTRRSVRAFWADGLWDIAMVGFAIITGIWGHVLVRVLAFPRSTWPWPFAAEHFRVELAYMPWLLLGVYVAAIALYFWCAWRVVLWLKAKWVEPYTGKVKHSFLLPIDPRTLLLYVVLYLGGLAALAGLYSLVVDGTRIYSAVWTASPAAIYFAIGRGYSLGRYRWTALAGIVFPAVLEITVTTPITCSGPPTSFLHVCPGWGSAALPMAVWAVLWFCSGLVGITNVRRQYRDRLEGSRSTRTDRSGSTDS